MCYNTCRRGQTMLEYVLAFTCLLGVIAALSWLVPATQRSVARTERLVRSNYP